MNSTPPDRRWPVARVAPVALFARLGRAAVLVTGVVLIALAGVGCGHNIGDGCSINTDCSPNNDRTCDLSQPGGYCTIEGCDQSSCPSDSACVRFFPEKFLSQPCDPACNLQDHPMISTDASMAPRCPGQLACSDPNAVCAADQLCLPSGLCVPRADEQRLCVKTCGSNGDCRGGYECRAAGTLGSLPLLGDPCATLSFCAPQVQTQ